MPHSYRKNIKTKCARREISEEPRCCVSDKRRNCSNGRSGGAKRKPAPDGAIVKVAGMQSLVFRGPARVFDCEEDAFEAVVSDKVKEGDVIIIRYEGPKGEPGMQKILSTTAACMERDGRKSGIITDGRFSGGTERFLYWSRGSRACWRTDQLT